MSLPSFTVLQNMSTLQVDQNPFLTILRPSLLIKTTEDLNCKPTQQINWLSPVYWIAKTCNLQDQHWGSITHHGLHFWQYSQLWILNEHCSSLVLYNFLLLGGDTPTGRRGKSDYMVTTSWEVRWIKTKSSFLHLSNTHVEGYEVGYWEFPNQRPLVSHQKQQLINGVISKNFTRWSRLCEGEHRWKTWLRIVYCFWLSFWLWIWWLKNWKNGRAKEWLKDEVRIRIGQC